MQPWTCSRCLVPCASEEIKCPACQELRPGYSPSDAEESSPEQPCIQFGAAPAAKAAESNGTPAFGPSFGAVPLPSHDPFASSSNVLFPATAGTANATQQLPPMPPFPRAASPQQHPVFGSQQMTRPEFGANTPLKSGGFSVQFGSQLSSSVDEEETPEMAAAPNVEAVEKENHSQSIQSDSNKASSTKIDAGRFTFGTSQLTHDFSSTPTSRPAPPSPLRASGQPSPGRFLDALATTPIGTSGPDSPLLRDYDPKQPKPYPKRDPSRRGILYNWGSGECDQLAIKQDCLEEGMCLQPMIIRRVNQPIAKSVVCGAMHNACIVSHGQAVWTWGCNDEKALGRPIRLDTKRRNANGEVYEIKVDGPLIDPCWSTVHPPPDSDYYLCKAPGPVWGLPDKVEIVKVTAGDSHTAIITATGDCWVWGTYRDGTGPLGFPDFSKERGAYVRHQIVPVRIPGLLGSCIRLISGENHTVVMTYCARDRKYRVYGWGANPYGQLGGTPTDHENPREYLWPREIKLSELQFTIAQSETSLCPHPKNELIRRNGVVGDIYGGRATLFIQVSYDGASAVFGMGRNACGELGAGCEVTCVSTPVALKTPPGYVWKDIKGGDWFTMGYTHDGAVFTWGHCEYVGQGTEIAQSKKNLLVPQKLPGLRQMVAEIAASDKGAYIVTYSGELFVWGENQSGQLGLGRQDEQPVARPTHVPLSAFSNQPVLSVAAGSQHAVALIQPDEAQLGRGTKRRREDDEAPAEDMELIKRRRADKEEKPQTPTEQQPDTSTDLPALIKAAVPPPAQNRTNTVELPVNAPSELSPSKKDEGYMSDDEPESGALPDEDSSNRRQSGDDDISMAEAGIGITASPDGEEEGDDEAEQAEDDASVVQDAKDAPAEEGDEDESNDGEPESNEGGDVEDEDIEEEAAQAESSDKAQTMGEVESDDKPASPDEVDIAEEAPATSKKPKAKAKAKARPKRAAASKAAQETAAEPPTGRSTRKRLATISATPADGDVSDISQPTEADAPKRSRTTASGVKRELRGVKRQASSSPEREQVAAGKKARTTRALKKGPASQETTPIPLAPAGGDTTTKASRAKGKAAGGESTTAAAARKAPATESKTATATESKAAAPSKKGSAEKAATEKATTEKPVAEKRGGRRGAKVTEEASPTQPEAEAPAETETQPAKKARGRAAATRAQSQEVEEAATTAKTAPKKAAAKPKSKAKAAKAPVTKEDDTDEEEEEVEAPPLARKGSSTTKAAATSKGSKSQPALAGKAATAATGKRNARTQPEEEVEEAASTTKKGSAKAKAKEMPRRATRSQAAAKETDAEPAATTRKAPTRSKK